MKPMRTPRLTLTVLKVERTAIEIAIFPILVYACKAGKIHFHTDNVKINQPESTCGHVLAAL